MLNKITDWFDGTSSAISYTYNTVKNMLKARKLTIERIVKNTDLTKKQAKKTVDGVLGLVDKSIEEDTSLENGERTEPYSILEFMLNIIHNIRNNKSYSKEVHQYCDNDIEVINEMVNEITIAKHNIDNEPNTPTKYGVRGIPTMLLFKGGELKATKVGATTKSNIVSWIKENI